MTHRRVSWDKENGKKSNDQQNQTDRAWDHGWTNDSNPDWPCNWSDTE